MITKWQSNEITQSAETGDFAIEVTDLVKVYEEGQIRAVDGLNLKISKGEIYALIGANGSGKTTAINLITGSLFPTSGSIKVLGFDVPRKRRLVASQIGVAPQEYAVYNDLTVEQNAWFFARLQGMEHKAFEKRLDELLPLFRLNDRRATAVYNLSGGMKRRVSVVCALVHDPKVIFLDEATVGIDPVLRAFFWDHFRSLASQGLTIVVTSHVMDEAERADRIGLMRAGRLIEEGTPQEIKQRHSAASIEEVFIKLSEGVIDG